MRLVFALLPVVAVLAAATSAHAVARPLVYVVVIDGLDGDRVDAGRAPFIASLLTGGAARATYYRESRSVMIAETNPNHVAMMTGAYGGRSGIVSNGFALYSPLASRDSCRPAGPVDESRAPTITTGESPTCLLAETVFGAVKRQGNPDDLLTAAVFGKPKLGRIFSGATAAANRRDVDHLWAPCSSGPEDDDYCGNVPTNPASGYAIDDRTVMDEVLRTIRQGVRTPGGGQRRPDFTFVNLHQVDSAGHGFGTGTGAYDTAILQADTEVGRLVGELISRGEWGRTVLLLVSDHSLDDTLTKTSLTEAFVAAGVARDQFTVIGRSSVDMIYLNDRTSEARFERLRRMRAAALANRNVVEALYREPNPRDGGATHTLDGAHPAWRLTGARTPDLLLTHAPGGSFADPSFSDQPLPGHHGAPQTLDNLFAVVGGGDFVVQADRRGVRAPDFDDTASNPDQAENADTASTVMGLFGLSATRQDAGRFLTEAFNLRALPGAGAPSQEPSVRATLISRGRPARRRPRPRRPRPGVRPRRPAFTGQAARPYRYRVWWAPGEARYDVQTRVRGAWRTVLADTSRTSTVVSRRHAERVGVRVRLRSVSGQPGPWRTRTLGPSPRRSAARR